MDHGHWLKKKEIQLKAIKVPMLSFQKSLKYNCSEEKDNQPILLCLGKYFHLNKELSIQKNNVVTSTIQITIN